MEELIKIENKQGIETVNARELHEKLQVGTRFNDWIKSRIEKYGFIENVDYVSLTEKIVSGNNANAKTYYVSTDMAKELAMVENNEQGRKIRRYFIDLENKAKAMALSADTRINMLTEMTIETQKQINVFMIMIPQLVAEVVKQVIPQLTKQLPDMQPTQDYYSIMAFCAMKKRKKLTITEAKSLGMEARRRTAKAGKEVHTVPDERFGKVGSYPVEILEQVFKDWETP